MFLQVRNSLGQLFTKPLFLETKPPVSWSGTPEPRGTPPEIFKSCTRFAKLQTPGTWKWEQDQWAQWDSKLGKHHFRGSILERGPVSPHLSNWDINIESPTFPDDWWRLPLPNRQLQVFHWSALDHDRAENHWVVASQKANLANDHDDDWGVQTATNSAGFPVHRVDTMVGFMVVLLELNHLVHV